MTRPEVTPKPFLLASLAAEQLQWAEDNLLWDYFEGLVALLHGMGASIIHLDRGYVISFRHGRASKPPQEPLKDPQGDIRKP